MMSHRLHSSTDAAAGFRSDEIPKKLPEGVSLWMFRVLQEALQNAAKHSGAAPLRCYSNAQIRLL
jgi:signal transduction histidine kinase